MTTLEPGRNRPVALFEAVNISIPRAIAAHAVRHPDSIAVFSASRFLTYYDLDCGANRLARVLRARGIRANSAVAICLPRSIETVVAALGVMRAGAAIVPLDPAHGSGKLESEVTHSRAALAITDSDNRHRMAGRECLDIHSPELSTGPDHLQRIDILPSDWAYIVGEEPVTHAELARIVVHQRCRFEIDSVDRASHAGSVASFPAIAEFWPYLSSGASIHVSDDMTRHSPRRLRDWLLSRNITICAVPARLAERMLTLEWPKQASLRFLITDERLNRDASRDFPFHVAEPPLTESSVQLEPV